ncbi:Uncharacterized protein ACMD2_21884 [Ananas comosus]|uniref:ABC1 atypical kinase-like domain-containing protein n=1 Tax=Ananas comosus TaxID=4615 RepID=A0A199VJG3_ANACO|nr:Uncharacterized protein ACMD2_21884 [Ananas comosus]
MAAEVSAAAAAAEVIVTAAVAARDVCCSGGSPRDECGSGGGRDPRRRRRRRRLREEAVERATGGKETCERKSGEWGGGPKNGITRPDIYGPDIFEALSELHEKVPPFPRDVAMKIIETKLGCPRDSIYSYISDEPIAAASFSQVA